MARRMELRGRWVLVTGASSGLGRAMSEVLARDHGARLVLTARRQEKLEALARRLATEHRVETACVPADITVPAELERLFADSTAGRTLHAVILNAGVTYWGHHLDLPPPACETMLATNVLGAVRLLNRFVPYLREQNEGGGLLLISSLGGSLAMPYQAVYGATKAFLTHLGLNLGEELRGENVSLTVFAPGGIATEMVETSGLSRRYDAASPWLMPVDRCARRAVRALVRRRAFVVPGFLNRLALLLARVLPRAVVRRLMANAYRLD